jgi:hypothetical protein
VGEIIRRFAVDDLQGFGVLETGSHADPCPGRGVVSAVNHLAAPAALGHTVDVERVEQPVVADLRCPGVVAVDVLDAHAAGVLDVERLHRHVVYGVVLVDGVLGEVTEIAVFAGVEVSLTAHDGRATEDHRPAVGQKNRLVESRPCDAHARLPVHDVVEPEPARRENDLEAALTDHAGGRQVLSVEGIRGPLEQRGGVARPVAIRRFTWQQERLDVPDERGRAISGRKRPVPYAF